MCPTALIPETGDHMEHRPEPQSSKLSHSKEGPVDRVFSWMKKLPMLGIILAIFSSGLIGICNVIVQKVELDSFTIAFYRFFGICLPAYPIMVYRGGTVGNRKGILFLRSILGASNLLIHFFALKHMPLADANMIAAASPIWCVIFSRIFLKEKISWFDGGNILITFIGIVFIIRPGFIFGYSTEDAEYGDMYFYSALALLGGSLLQANVYIMLRLLKDIHFSTTLSVFGSIGVLESGIFMFALGGDKLPCCGLDRWLMTCIGLVSFGGQVLLTISAQVEEAGKISLARKAGDILFAFLFQITIFNKVPGPFKIVGAVLISSAVILSGGKKLVNNLPADHPIKTKYLRLCYQQADEDGLDLPESGHLCRDSIKHHELQPLHEQQQQDQQQPQQQKHSSEVKKEGQRQKDPR